MMLERETVMSQQSPPAEAGAVSVLDRIGIPRQLFWGFAAVLIFMIGDGVETTYLSDYLQQPEGGGLANWVRRVLGWLVPTDLALAALFVFE